MGKCQSERWNANIEIFSEFYFRFRRIELNGTSRDGSHSKRMATILQRRKKVNPRCDTPLGSVRDNKKRRDDLELSAK